MTQGGDEGQWWPREMVTKGNGEEGKWWGWEVVTKGSGDEGKWWGREVVTKGSGEEGKWWPREMVTKGSSEEGRWWTKGSGDFGKWWLREVVTKGSGDEGKWWGREVVTKGSGEEGKWWLREVVTKGSGEEGKWWRWWRWEVVTLGSGDFVMGCMNVAWGLCWGGSRSTKAWVFPCKVAAAGDERYLVCVRRVRPIFSAANVFLLCVLQRVVVPVCVVLCVSWPCGCRWQWNGCMIVVIWCCHVRRSVQVCDVMRRNAL